MTPSQRQAFFERLRALNPHPKTELEYSTPFELLVAVILSAQATDRSVNLATRRLFPVACTPQAILDLGVEGLSEYVRSIGLYQGKARNIVATCRILLEQHDGEVPADRARLEALPGVGPQDRERDPEHRLRPADDGGGHAHLPRRQPHGPRAGQDGARGRGHGC